MKKLPPIDLTGTCAAQAPDPGSEGLAQLVVLYETMLARASQYRRKANAGNRPGTYYRWANVCEVKAAQILRTIQRNY